MLHSCRTRASSAEQRASDAQVNEICTVNELISATHSLTQELTRHLDTRTHWD